jgi:hypothetical protein
MDPTIEIIGHVHAIKAAKYRAKETIRQQVLATVPQLPDNMVTN